MKPRLNINTVNVKRSADKDATEQLRTKDLAPQNISSLLELRFYLYSKSSNQEPNGPKP